MSTGEVGVFNQSLEQWHPSSWGSAEMSQSEFRSLRRLYSALRVSLFGDARRELSPQELQILRESAVGTIIDYGWPRAEEVSLTDLSETATLHACSVAGRLMSERGIESAPETVWSYTTKNQVHRFLTARLDAHARSSGDYTALIDWMSPKPRDLEHVTDTVYIPQGVDSRYAYGVAKVECYWPAQLLRNLEAYRLGGASLPGVAPEMLKIPWMMFDGVASAADSATALAVGIALRSMQILGERGVPGEQISSLILSGYSPGGPIRENGYIPEVGRIWESLLSSIYYDPQLTGLYEGIGTGVSEKLRAAGYPAEYASFIQY